MSAFIITFLHSVNTFIITFLHCNIQDPEVAERVLKRPGAKEVMKKPAGKSAAAKAKGSAAAPLVPPQV